MGRNSEDVLTDPPPPAADVRLAYGSGPKQFGDLRLPAVDRLLPLAIVVHGGSWKAMYNLIHTGHLCVALGDAGIATWNLEYRSCGDPGGTWPGAGDDVAAAVEFVEKLVAEYPLDAERIVLVGHSAGGQLALWVAKRARFPVVALAAVSDLRESATRVGPEGDVARFLGGMPDDVPYPQSASYAEAAGDEAELITLGGAGHFEPIDPQAREWPRTIGAIQAIISEGYG